MLNKKTRAPKPGTPPRSQDGLYESDFYSWTQEQATLLRAGRLSEIDLQNIAEEIESLGRSEASALKSAYRVLAMHLLKIVYQRNKVTASWRITLGRERLNIADILDENPGLEPKRQALFAKAYAIARREASLETGLSIDRFPIDPPFSVDDVEAADFWPEPTARS